MEIVGIDETKVKAISEKKKESDWIKEFRLESYKNFCNIDMPSFGPKIDLNFDDVIYYKSNDRDEAIQNDWNSVLKPVVDELDELGVFESEKHFGDRDRGGKRKEKSKKCEEGERGGRKGKRKLN